MLARFLLIVALFWLSGCGGDVERARVIGQAYAGPLKLNVYEELGVRSAVKFTVEHGDKVDIIGKRRRFFKVRSAKGEEGWVDSRQLLSPADMDLLRRQTDRALKLPSMGDATSFDPLNIHSIPNRQAPSFFQLKVGDKIQMLGTVRAPRVPYTPTIPLPGLVIARPVKKAPPKDPKKIPPPPPGPAPQLPENWLELSGNPELKVPAENAEEKPAIPMDDWTFVRTKDNRAGWVMTRLLVAGIPDEVAQYAERARITSYFQLDSPTRKDQKPSYLWTTLVSGGKDYDFDSFRIFWNNPRRHRYETAYIERGVRGYFPVIAQSGTVPTFALLVANKEGQLVRKKFVFRDNRVRLTGQEPGEKPPPLWTPEGEAAEDIDSEENDTPRGFAERMKEWWATVKKRFGR